MKLALFVAFAVSLVVAIPIDSSTDAQADGNNARPAFTVPTLTAVRAILAQLEAPIISTLTERINLKTSAGLYANNGDSLNQYFSKVEGFDRSTGRFNYGKLEYPFTLQHPKSDHVSDKNPFPPGTFHLDGYNANTGLYSWYVNTFIPTFNPPMSFFYHLDNTQENDAAALHLDVSLLQLISHRCYIGQVVAETKYAAAVSQYTPLIQAQDATSIRTLLTNVTQEGVVLQQAATAATAFSTAWSQSGAAEPASFPSDLQTAAASLFRKLIDTTTDIEVQYLLQRFN